MKNWFNLNKVHFAVIGIFIALCFVYFMPIWQGKVLQQTDVTQAQAMQHEIMSFKEKDGKAPLWTNSMFGGMPSYQIWVSYPKNIGTHIMAFFKTVAPYPMDAVLFYLIGAYILFIVLKVRPWLAAVGAIAFAFSSYNFIYIEAGHASKAYAIGFFAPVLAGVMLALQGRYLLGASLLAFALALEIRVNHIQTTYYLFIAIMILMIIEFVYAMKAKALASYLKSIAYMFVAAVVAVAVNAGLLLTTYEYSQESIRGKANIASDGKEANQTGVDRDYAYQWSQGVGESITFLVPNAYGGGLKSLLDNDSEVAKVLNSKGYPANQIIPGIATYWGEKPFTSGPWYFGAIVLFLFVLGLFTVRGRFKWWILAATLLSVFLSFGRHLPFISDLFFHYFPLYKSFRAVESNLVVASFLIPILAVIAIEQLLVRKDTIINLDKKFLYALGIVGGMALLVWLLPSLFFDFKGASHNNFVQGISQQTGDNAFGQALGNALVQDRASIARSDAFRSLAYVLLAAGLVWLYLKKKVQQSLLVLGLGALILLDMWGVNKRYLGKDSFVDKSVMVNQISPREVDELIMMDKDPNYRVFDLTGNGGPFNTATYAYYHKMIGGYHAAKLMRYQELIENQFANAINEDVLDMLNTRYLIVSEQQNNSQRIQRRSSALGNAWFVDRITYVKNDEEEMDALDSFDPHREAFINESYKDQLTIDRIGLPTNGSIELIDYRPDHLVYEYSVPNDVFAVFSEIYYSKGWKAFVDGEELPIIRADYLLRALQLPGGNHRVEFKFEPQSYYTGEMVSLIASILLVLGLAFGIWLEVKKEKTNTL